MELELNLDLTSLPVPLPSPPPDLLTFLLPLPMRCFLANSVLPALVIDPAQDQGITESQSRAKGKNLGSGKQEVCFEVLPLLCDLGEFTVLLWASDVTLPKWEESPLESMGLNIHMSGCCQQTL